jgi:hypothetical protein
MEILLPRPELLSFMRFPERNLPSLMLSETMLHLNDERQLVIFTRLDDLSIIIGKASQYTQTKVLQPGQGVEPDTGGGEEASSIRGCKRLEDFRAYGALEARRNDREESIIHIVKVVVPYRRALGMTGLNP